MISMRVVLPAFNVTLLFTVSVPMALLPGEFVPPELIVVAPLMMPVPVSVAPVLTVTAPLPVPLPLALFTVSVPPSTIVPPL